MSEGADRPHTSRFGFGRPRSVPKSVAGTLPPPLPPPRHSQKKQFSEESVTKQVIQTTTSLKETNRNIQGLTSLVKEQKSTGTFKSKFGFKPGIFNNKNAASNNVKKVSKVIDDVDTLSRRADKVSSLVRGLEAAPRRHTAESDYISSGDSNSSNISGSSISTSDSDPRPARPNLNRVLDCNSNTAPPPGPPAKPLRSADRRNIAGGLSSPRLRRAAASPLGSPKSPRSPRPRPRLLPKPSSGPSPYRSLATSTAKPLVTSASGEDPPPAPLLPPTTCLATTDAALIHRSSTSQLPGLRASFFATEPRRLDSASLHSQGLLATPSSRLRAPARPTMVQRVRPSLDDSAPQASDSESARSSLASISSIPSVAGRREGGKTRAFVQHRAEARPSPGQRKWVAGRSPAPPPTSAPSPRSHLDCLALLKSSNKQAIDVARPAGRTRLFASKKSSLPAIAQEERAEHTLEDEMVVKEEKEEALSKSLSSPTETEDDSGIFTSAHSKYSLESLGEEVRPSATSRIPSITGAPSKLTRSYPPDYGWSQDVRAIRSKPAVVMARSEPRPGARGFLPSRSVHNFSDSGEEFASRETSPMQLLDEICLREEEEEEEKGRNRIVPGLVSSRKQLLEAAILHEKKTRQDSPRASEERDPDTTSSPQAMKKDQQNERPKQRSFVGLKSASCLNGRLTDFSAISGIPQLDQLSLQLPSPRLHAGAKEASPSLSEGSDTSSDLTSVSLHLEQPVEPVVPVMSTSTTSSSNLSQAPEGKKLGSPDQADFLIDDDYNDQQELTFYGHDDSIEESLFEKVDSLLSRRQESQEKDEDVVDGKETGVGEVVNVNVDFSPKHLPKIDELKLSEAVSQRRASVDTLASQASIARDDEDVMEDCMLDFDFEERRQSCKAEEGLVEEKAEEEQHVSISRSSSSASDEGIILDKSSYEAVKEEVGDVRAMLLKLRRVLQEADTVNPFDADVSLRPGNLYANLVLAESEQLVSAAEAIEKLSAAAAAGQDTIEDFSDPVRDISDTAVRKTVEENQDLRRQVVFLQQTVEERDRRIRALESLLVGDRANSTSSSQASINTATQTEKARPKSMGSSRSTSSSEDPQAMISPAEPRAPSRPPSSTSRISRPLRSPLPLHTARRAESPRLPPPRRPESPRLVSRRPESPRVTSPRVTSPRVTSPRVPAAGRHPASTRQAWLYSTSSSGSEASTEGSTRCRPSRPGAYPSILPRAVSTGRLASPKYFSSNPSDGTLCISVDAR